MQSLRQYVLWFLRSLALMTVLSCTVLIGLGLWTMHTKHIQLLGVATGSMAPTINTGDGLLVEAVTFKDVAVGDIVSFRSRSYSGVVSHRIVTIDQARQQIVTKGDHNSVSDSPVAAKAITGRVVRLVPHAGRVQHAVRTPLGLTLVLYVPAGCIIFRQLRRLQASFQPVYRLYGSSKVNRRAVSRARSIVQVG